MKLLAPLLLSVVLVLLLAACGGGDEEAAGMDGLIDGVPVSEYEATTTVVPETTTTTTTTSTLPTTTVAPDASDPTEAADPPEEADVQVWRSATAAVCEAYEPRITSLTAELGSPATLAAAAGYLDRVNPLNARYMRAIVAVPLPESRRTEVEDLYVLANDLKEVARVAQAAAHFDDQASYDEATAELDAAGASANELLLELGLPECVAEADGGTA